MTSFSHALRTLGQVPALVQLLFQLGIVWTYQSLNVGLALLARPGCHADKRGARVAEQGVVHPPVKGVTHENFEVDGVRIHVARAGVGKSKPLLLFLHGFPEFWYSWRAQIEALQGEFEIAAVDMPGYNASDKPAKRCMYVTSSIASMMAGVVRALGRAQCTVVGHDWGGVIAWDMAALYPETVERLVVLAAPAPRLFDRNMDAGQHRRSAYILAFQQPWVAEMALRADDYRMLSSVFNHKSQMGFKRRECSEEEIERYKDALAQPGAVTAALNYYRAAMVESRFLGNNNAARVANKRKLEMPTLVLWADQDAALSLNLLTNIGSVASRVSVHVIPECSHWIQQDAPEAVNRLISLFMHDKLPVTSRL